MSSQHQIPELVNYEDEPTSGRRPTADFHCPSCKVVRRHIVLWDTERGPAVSTQPEGTLTCKTCRTTSRFRLTRRGRYVLRSNQQAVEALWEAAREHGENSEPDHEVGDLQQFLEVAWRLMTSYQREQFWEDGEVIAIVSTCPEYEELREAVYGHPPGTAPEDDSCPGVRV